jgi:hypothetical protein
MTQTVLKDLIVISLLQFLVLLKFCLISYNDFKDVNSFN